ncbi:MAG TPA: CoA transferase [Candidatus Tectomicrobia bacterium]|nr:CoA transferase [Candidatus Tectomicrobia bacterium]
MSSAPILAGVRVIDAASFIAGPVAATVMADLGADVVKLEPPGGDTYRVRGSGYPPCAYDFPWIVDNRTKRSVAIDLWVADGQRLLHCLVRGADVFITNAPGRSRAPGDPPRGPGAAQRAADLRVGDRVRRDRAGGEPAGLRQHGALGADRADGPGAAVSGPAPVPLAARHGRPSHRQLALRRHHDRAVPPRAHGPGRDGLDRCRDGRWFLLSHTADERRWPEFAAAVGLPHLIDDPRFASRESRRANARALVGLLDEAFATRDWAEWRPVLEATGVAFGLVATLDDVAADEQARASGALVPIDDPRAGAALTVGSPLDIAGHTKVPPRLAPALGEHTVEVLREAGVAPEEIDRLRRAGVVVQASPRAVS